MQIFDEIFRKICEVDSQSAIFEQFFLKSSRKDAFFRGDLIQNWRFLNVSRPYLIQLLEKGALPFHSVGRHRRVLFEDLLKYKAESSKIREKLTRDAQDLGLGY